jgi:lysylphosphatidylglycerol synthetase-like protein (DUF2156 family)
MSTTPTSIGQMLWIGIRFVLFGLVGFCLMLVSSFSFMVAVFAHRREFISPFLSLPLIVIGALMMLYGVGEWRRWGYLWVFLSIPISLCLLFLIPAAGSDKGLSLIVAAIAAFISYVVARAHYSPRVRDERHDDAESGGD